MSGSEYERLAGVTDAYRDEVASFGRRLAGRCAALASVGELVAFTDCLGEAYAVVEGQYYLSHGAYEDLLGATAKTCRQRVRLLDRRIRQIQGTLSAVNESAGNLEFTEAEARVAARFIRQRSARFLGAYQRARGACRPK